MPRGGAATGQTGRKRTKTEREQALAVTAKLDRLGYNQFQIAEQLAAEGFTRVSQVQIGKDLRAIRDRSLEILKDERQAKVEEMAAIYRDVRMEAAQAFQKSKRRVKPVKCEDGSIEMVEVESLPLNEYLTTVVKTVDRECELRGLDAPKKMDVRQLSIDWDALAGEIPNDVADAIEQKLQELLPGSVRKNALHELPAPKKGDAPSGNGENGEQH